MDAAYDPCRPEWRDDPYPLYRELRDTVPVYRAPTTRDFCISRYNDMMFVLRKPG